MDDATLAALRVAASAGIDIGFAAAVGALATAAILAGAESTWAAPRARRAWRLFTLASATAFLASLAWIWIATMAMTDLGPVDALGAIGGVVEGTHFGRFASDVAWGLLACAGWGVIGWRRARSPRIAIAVNGLLLAMVAVARAAAGHAGAHGPSGEILVMAVHLVAIGAWAGAVFGAVLVVLPGPVDRADAQLYAGRLSSLATSALVLVLLTGALRAWHGLGGSFAPLAPSAGSTWGLVLDAKLAGVVLATALGAFNRLVTLPALRSPATFDAAWRRFFHILCAEAVVMLGVLVAAALLGNGEPPAV